MMSRIMSEMISPGSIISSYKQYTILDALKTIKTERETNHKNRNDGDEMRQAEQAHDMDAYTLDLPF